MDLFIFFTLFGKAAVVVVVRLSFLKCTFCTVVILAAAPGLMLIFTV